MENPESGYTAQPLVQSITKDGLHYAAKKFLDKNVPRTIPESEYFRVLGILADFSDSIMNEHEYYQETGTTTC